MLKIFTNIMSENTSEERNNLFRDYKSENFDDSDLQSRLYAEIYYESNIEGESETSDISRTTRFANMVAEPESMQQKPEDKQPVEFEAARGKSSRAKKTSREHCNQNAPLSNESSVIEPLMYNDTLHAQNSADVPASDEIQTNTDELSGREMNHVIVIHEHDNINNDNPGSSSMEKEKKGKESVAKKHKSSNYTKRKHQKSSPSKKDHIASPNDTIHSKYNVLSKCVKRKERFLDKLLKEDKQTSDSSSDSEESIFEVPVPPKPKPPVINLQDSDEENNTNSGMNDLISEKVIPSTSHKVRGVSSSRQGTSSKNRSSDKSLHNKDTTVNPRNIHTRMQDIREDIVLNCTIVQRGARSISEIKQLSKSAEFNKNQGHVSAEDTNQNSTKHVSQNTSTESNANFQQELFVTPGRRSYTRMQQNIDKSNAHSKYNFRIAEKNNTLDAEVSGSNDTAINRKRQYDSRIESPKEKRQCIVQQNHQNVMQQSSSSSSSSRERRNESRNEHFDSMSDTLRNHYYNTPRGQENFDVGELQQSMSKDPRMWMIMDADLMPCPPSRQRTRFWNVRCSNCHRDGHQRYDCPVPRRVPCCYICGEKSHVESRCPQKICLTCGKQQNTFRKTCAYCRVLYCTMCHSIGHESTQCPDLWRRYHQTTDMSGAPQDPGNVMKPRGSLHCCNCTKRGHESSMCTEYRWSQHFQTPTAVTNYTDGPMYAYATDFSDPDFEADTLSSRATSSRSSVSYSPKNIQQTTEEHWKSSTSVDTSSSSTRANEMPIPQGTPYNLEIEENLESSSMVNKMLRPEEKQREHRQNGIKEEEFTTIIYSCGKFRDKDNEDARMILKNLSLKNLSSFGRRTISSLPKRRIAPVFLQTLFDKAIQFEVKIGFTRHQHQAIMLQLIAMKEYIELIQRLLHYWINLPENEKDYGVDVTLPMNPTKMFNHLCSRMPQLTKMRFTCYNDHIIGINDPRWLFNAIKDNKLQLEKHNGSRRQYSKLRTRMWRLQVKLLMIVNTEPKPNVHVTEFQDAMKQLESKKRDQTIEKLDIATYLKLTMLYNRLFVPHTSTALFGTLRRITKHEEMITKNTTCYELPQMLQELEEDGMCEQENLASHFNVNSSLPFATSCTSQNINSAENPSAIDIQQNTSNETLIERRDVVDLTTMINDTIACHDDDEVMIMEDSVAQDSETIMSLYTEVFNYDEPILIPTEDRNEGKLLRSGLRIKCNPRNPTKAEKNGWKPERLITRKMKRRLEMDKMYQTASQFVEKGRALKIPRMTNAANELERRISNQTLTQKDVKNMKKLLGLDQTASQLVEQARALEIPHAINVADELERKISDHTIMSRDINIMRKMINLNRTASHLLKEARAFKLPHMMNAANELERKIRNETVMPKHVSAMKKLIRLEKKHRKNISSCSNDLKT